MFSQYVLKADTKNMQCLFSQININRVVVRVVQKVLSIIQKYVLVVHRFRYIHVYYYVISYLSLKRANCYFILCTIILPLYQICPKQGNMLIPLNAVNGVYVFGRPSFASELEDYTLL